jgi:hypothetical protein
MDELITNGALLKDSTLSTADILAILSENDLLTEEIRSKSDYIISAASQIKEDKILASDIIESLNSSITTTLVIEDNQKTVNNIYLQTIAKGLSKLDSGQAAIINGIANQCPVSGGKSVYQARALYKLFDRNVVYNDKLTCLQGGIALRESEKKEPMDEVIFPNLADDKATATYHLSSDGYLKVVNSMGEEIIYNSLSCKMNQITFDTSELNNGVYILIISDNVNPEVIGKLVISGN